MTSLAAALLASFSLAPAQDPPPAPAAASAMPKVGDRAPALQFDHVLGATGALDLAGKVVVLEFSTSWCGGCRAGVPHWNALAKELAGQAVVLVTVTNEDKAAAEKFVADTGLATPLAIDADGSLFEAFGVPGIPDVVVIGADGRIAAFAHPAKLEAAALRDLAAGRPATFDGGAPRARRSWDHGRQLSADDVAPGTVTVRPCSKPSGMLKMDPKTGIVFAGGLPMRTLFATAFDCPIDDVELDPALPDKALWELSARGGDDTVAGTRKLLRERLARELGVALTTSMVESKALILRRADGAAPLPAPDASRKGGSVRAGEIRLGSATGSKLAELLRRALSLTVIDETGVTSPFAVDLEWDAAKGIAGLRPALATAGFSLEETKRPLPRHRLTPVK